MKKVMHLFAQIAKIDEARHEVWGVATSEIVDKDGEIFDYKTSKPYFKAWSAEISKATDGKSLGNVREMHTPSAVGKLVELGFDDELKEIRVAAKIVDAEAWQKCKQGVYTGFSIGGTYVKAWKDGECTRYTAKPVEISVVDNPCNPGAHFTAVKADGTWEVRKFALRPKTAARSSQQKGTEESMEKTDAKHSAETRAHHEAIAKCIEKIAQACGEAKTHVDALLGKDETESAAWPAFSKRDSAVFQPEIRTGEQPMNEKDIQDLEKAGADSASALSKVAEVERGVASLRSEMKRNLEELGEALANLTEAIAKMTEDGQPQHAGIARARNSGDGTQKVARTSVRSFTIRKEDDGGPASKSDEDTKSVHELLKQTFQNPQRASNYLR